MYTDTQAHRHIATQTHRHTDTDLSVDGMQPGREAERGPEVLRAVDVSHVPRAPDLVVPIRAHVSTGTDLGPRQHRYRFGTGAHVTREFDDERPQLVRGMWLIAFNLAVQAHGTEGAGPGPRRRKARRGTRSCTQREFEKGAKKAGSSAIGLRVSYAMPGTEIAYGGGCALSGTEIVYGGGITVQPALRTRKNLQRPMPGSMNARSVPEMV
eukprot:3787459-Rhodomonas_salina.1